MLIAGIDPNDLSQAGWGVVFISQEEPAVKEALRPLLQHRMRQADGLYKELIVNAGESALDFRFRHGVGPGPLDPRRMPFYLLLIGCPESIPFEFQYQLSVYHAVGRLHFDRPEEYSQYSERVVAVSSQKILPPRRACFVSVQNPNDIVTTLVFQRLVRPMATELTSRFSDWTIEAHTGEKATKSALLQMLTSDEAPNFLFIAAHSYSYRSGHERQRDYQGSLICQDWPGPSSGCPIEESHVLNADDLDESLRLPGSLIFLLSAHSAGTPQFDDFHHIGSETESKRLAPRPFISRLSQRLLSHESFGSLAVIGHVDRAWTSIIGWSDDESIEDRTLNEVFAQLLHGDTVGWAMRPLVHRFVDLAAQLSELLHDRQANEGYRDLIANLWTGMKDARNYIVLGDPAVNLAIEDHQVT